MIRTSFFFGIFAVAWPSTLFAQDFSSEERDIEEDIVVTGERVPRSELETASSLELFTADEIEAASIDRLDQLLALVPNVQPGSGEEAPTIRGQDATGQLRNLFAFLGGARPRTTLQVDGRPASFYEFISGSQSTWDVAQIEVFRSPQTTTQGRNSIAGAIFVTTEQPALEWEARGRAIVGNFDTRQISAVLSGPIVEDQLAFRVSGDLHRGELSNDMTDGVEGADINRNDYGMARIKLAYQPAGLPDTKIETTFAYTQSQSPQFEGASPPFPERRLPVPNQMIGVMKVHATSVTARAEHKFASDLSSSVTMSYGDAVLRRFGLPGLGHARADTTDFSIEPILLWEGKDAFSLLVGANRFTMRQKQTIDISGFGLGIGEFKDEQDSFGLFGEASWEVRRHLFITGGLRYEEDRQIRVGGIGGIALDYDETFKAWLPKVTIAFRGSDDFTVGILAQRAFNPGGTSISLARRGPDEFDAEHLWNYEAFLRARAANGRLTFTANAFYADIEDAQRPQLVPVRLPNGIQTQSVEFANAPAARSYGFEAAFDWKPRADLSLQAAVGLLDTKVDRTLEPGDATLGKSFQRSPGLSASGAFDWLPVTRLRLSMQVRHHSGYFSDDANSEALRIRPTTVVDGRASYDLGPAILFGYARNLFDEFYLTNLFNSNFASTGKPREIGVGLEASF